jgi:RNA polymerase sigma-70 factor (sigma-E family)
VSTIEAFEAFVVARYGRLVRTAYLLTNDRALAEDLVQTTLTKTWFAWSRISGDPEPYVRKVMLNTYAAWWRRKWNGERATADLPDGRTVPGPADSTGERADLWQALHRLTRRQRAVLVLRYYEDLTIEQTADVLGCSAGTVKSQTSRALAKLRIDPALITDQATEEEKA